MPERLFGKAGCDEKIMVTDIDGVLADSKQPVVSRVNKMFGLDLRHEDINGWNWVAQEVTRLTGDKKAGERAERVWFDPDVMVNSPPVSGSREVTEMLVDSGWQVWAATSRLPDSRSSTREWIDEYFPHIGSERVYMRGPGMEKIVSSADVKLLAVGMLGARLYVEDDLMSVEYVAENWGSNLVIAMLSQGWNASAGPAADKYRVKDWGEIWKISGKIK